MTAPSAPTLTAADLQAITNRVKTLFEVRDRRYGVTRTLFEKCFVGEQAVAAMIDSGLATDTEDAVRLGNLLLEAGVFHHVQNAHPFKNEYLFYRFSSDEDHGAALHWPGGGLVRWADFLGSGGHEPDVSLIAKIPPRDPALGSLAQADLEAIGIEPPDEHNLHLLDNVRPRMWRNPAPKPRYNLVAIGGGAGGLISSGIVAGMGGRAALIEAHLLGGDCLNVGCVPSKALIRSAHVANELRDAERYGVRIDGKVEVDFAAVMRRMRALRAEISHADSAQRYASEKGVDVFIGHAHFAAPDCIDVDGARLRFSKAVIATGGSAAIPAIPGIEGVPVLTNANVFNLTELPRRLAVIGAGPIGMELAQAFCRFGAQVVVLSRSGRILPREEPEAAELVRAALEAEGVRFEDHVDYQRVESGPKPGTITLHYRIGKAARTLEVDGLLAAIGRKPNVEGLGLEAAGIDYDPREGITIDDELRTTNRSVYAIGDVATPYQFTHVSDFMARMAVRNAVAFGSERFSRLLIPWATFTDPEVAHVGLYEADLRAREIPFTTFRKDFREVDRAIVDGTTAGYVKIHVRRGKDEILGATTVGRGAGEAISEISVAMRAGMGLAGLANVIHPYPTAAEAIRACGDSYNASRLTPTVRSVLSRLLALQR